MKPFHFSLIFEATIMSKTGVIFSKINTYLVGFLSIFVYLYYRNKGEAIFVFFVLSHICVSHLYVNEAYTKS